MEASAAGGFVCGRRACSLDLGLLAALEPSFHLMQAPLPLAQGDFQLRNAQRLLGLLLAFACLRRRSVRWVRMLASAWEGGRTASTVVMRPESFFSDQFLLTVLTNLLT